MKKVSDKLCLSDNSYNGKTSSGFDNILQDNPNSLCPLAVKIG